MREKNLEPHGNEEHLSDTGSWGSDFEDEANEDPSHEIQNRQWNRRISNNQKAQDNATPRQKDVSKQEEGGIYANCGSMQGEQNLYANCQESKIVAPMNASRLHSQIEKSLAEQLKEQLQLRNTKKPMVRSKPPSLNARKVEPLPLESNQPRKSFLHDTSKTKQNVPSQTQSEQILSTCL